MGSPADRSPGDPVAVPRTSATVVLARPAERAPELYLVHRRSGPTFGASYVFPGGLVDAGDGEAAAFSEAFPHHAAGRCLGLAAGALDYYGAAIRELFEETGVLLASHRGRAALPPAKVLEGARARLNGGRLRWVDFVREHELVLACDALHYFAWWITPRACPTRFSTRFFLAALPAGQEASHDGRELTDSRWMTAADAIEAAAKGELVLPRPTRATLRDLAAFRDLPGMLDWARRRAEEGVPRLLPAIVSEGGRDRVLMPGDPGYPPDAGQGET